MRYIAWQNIDLGQPVVLDGTNTAPDGEPITYVKPGNEKPVAVAARAIKQGDVLDYTPNANTADLVASGSSTGGKVVDSKGV